MTATATAVRERPILFSGPMVRAILDGRKTQTRRVITPQPMSHPGGKYEPSDPWLGDDGIWRWMTGVVSYTYNDVRCPFGSPGDRLWVRETFNHFFAGEQASSCLYLADAGTHRWRQAPSEEYAKREWSGWKPSIHMPRWASRLTLEIIGVRVERVQEISERDAHDEGIEQTPEPYPQWGFGGGSGMEARAQDAWVAQYGRWYRDRYRSLWDSLNAARGYGWDVSPWVWVISFRRITQETENG